MTTLNFTTGFSVDQTPGEVFNAIKNVRGWWSEEIKGSTERLNDEFIYHYKDVHLCRIKIIEVVPDQRIVWLVLENHFKFTEDKSEWTGNRMVFDITKKDNKTQLQFTQMGLVPQYECYDICSDAWSNYINNSLRNLITIGKGHPSPKESEFDEQLLEHHNKK